MNIKNYTNSPVAFLIDGELPVEIPSSGVAFAGKEPLPEFKTVKGLPVPVRNQTSVFYVTGLPQPERGTAFLVSEEVIEALRGSGRKDVYACHQGRKNGLATSLIPCQ